jgi:hypothetical protein
MLRLSCALDRSHTSVVERLAVHSVDRKIELSLLARGDADLEEWAVRRKQGLFEETFDVELTVSTESTGRTLWEAEQAEVAGLG